MNAAEPMLISLRQDASGFLQAVSQPDPDGPISVLPFSFPADCSIYDSSPNPTLALLAVEFLCGDGPLVMVYDVRSAESWKLDDSLQADARFLTWSADGGTFYLKTDTLGDSKVVRFDASDKKPATLDLPGELYDMTSLPDGRLLYSLTSGIGFGSEVWQTDQQGRHARQILD